MTNLKKRRGLSILLVAVMIFGLLPGTAFADAETEFSESIVYEDVELPQDEPEEELPQEEPTEETGAEAELQSKVGSRERLFNLPSDSALQNLLTNDYGVTLDQDLMDMSEAYTLAYGSPIKIVGQLTYRFGDGNATDTSIFQDVVDGETVGIQIYNTMDGYEIGDIFEISGTTQLHNGVVQINGAAVELLASQDQLIAEPQEVTIAEIKSNTIEYLSEVVRIKNAKLGDYYGSGDYTQITDSTGSMDIYRAAPYPDGINAKDEVDVIAVVSRYNTTPLLRTGISSVNRNQNAYGAVTITGKVYEAGTMNGVDGAEIKLTGNTVDYDTQSNADGTFILRDIVSGTYTLTVTASGYKVCRQNNVQITGETNLGTIELVGVDDRPYNGIDLTWFISNGIYYGTYNHAVSLADGYTGIAAYEGKETPVLWRAVGEEEDNGNLTLLSEYVIDSAPFNENSGDGNVYDESAIKETLASMTIFNNTEFLHTVQTDVLTRCFNTSTNLELDEFRGTTYPVKTRNQILYLPWGKYFSNPMYWEAGATGNSSLYRVSPRNTTLKNGTDVYYWLRSPATNNITIALCVRSSGSVESGRVDLYYGVRPAFQLDPSAILFASEISDFADEKMGQTQSSEYYSAIPAVSGGSNYKLTVINDQFTIDSLMLDNKTLIGNGSETLFIQSGKNLNFVGSIGGGADKFVYTIVEETDQGRTIVGYGTGSDENLTVNSIANLTNGGSLKIGGNYKLYIWAQKNREISSHEGSKPMYFSLAVTPIGVDATLWSVVGIAVIDAGEPGTFDQPKTAAISVDNSVNKVEVSDIVPMDSKASVQLYSDAAFTKKQNTVSLDAGNVTSLFIKVIAEDKRTTMYYCVTVKRDMNESISSSSGGSASSTYTVRFETNGGTAAKSQHISRNGKAVEPETPVKEGHEFTGWYVDSVLTTLYDFNKKVTGSFTLYAGWKAVDGKEEEQEQFPAELENKAYISGYPDGTFRPDENVARAEAAQMIYSIENRQFKEESTLFGTFSDVEETDWYYTAVGNLAGWGIVSGRGLSGEEPVPYFAPEAPITRAEFLVMAFRYAEFRDLPVEEKQFSDVEIDHWAAGWIKTAVSQGMVSGYPDGTFRPDDTITRAEAVTILNAVLYREALAEGNSFTDVPKSHWAYGAITSASTEH